ncbi:MAG: glycosyltransferase [Planctomycetes bacterium]|nr:glycosyltransferase [Planctomycetota bacterium]
MSTLSKSLSVVVPVHDAERNLRQQIGHLLEVLPDIAPKFEVLIVDDGSIDQTEDVALELSHEYPQVRVVRHSEQRGIQASAQTGAAHTTGDIVIVHAGQQPVNASQLQRAWRHREDEELIVAPVGSSVGGISSEVLRQLEDWGQCVADEYGDADERSDTSDQPESANRRTGGRPAARIARGPKKASIPAPMFRFSSSDSHSSMHQ